MCSNHYSRSIEIIRENQSKWGSYVASPAFPTYHYCWLRDGSFIAHAMDTAGEYENSRAFYTWVGKTIMKYGSKLDIIREKQAIGLPILKDDILHTRFSLEGVEEDSDSDWGNFQVDGYGSWLWALVEHVKISGDGSLLQELADPIRIILDYLSLVWQLPNYDCWEEHPEYLHPYSLAAVYAGVEAIASMIRIGQMTPASYSVDEFAAKVKAFILKYGVADDKLVKMILPASTNAAPQAVGQMGVDSSLIGVLYPYQVFLPDDVVTQTTIHAIERDLLRPGGGIYRYAKDEYYGGGEWLLLTAWLGWYYASAGQIEKAEWLREWIESCVDENGFMPEQVSEHVLSPEHYQPWVKKWGPIANPLLWSHAMYIILVNAIEEGRIND